MDDAGLMACADRGTHAEHHVNDRRDGKKSRARLDEVSKVTTTQVLHRQIRRIARVAEVENPDHVAMLDLGYGESFSEEALARQLPFAGTETVGAYDLESNGPPQSGVDSSIDRAHSTFADQLPNLEPVDEVAFRECRIRAQGAVPTQYITAADLDSDPWRSLSSGGW